jgi:hypothetical protein
MTPTQASKNDLGCRRSVAVAVFVRSVSARPVSGTGNGETKQPAVLMVTVDSSTRRKGCTRAYEGGVRPSINISSWNTLFPLSFIMTSRLEHYASET